ncbi:hypothetical protein I3760_15G012300 [Carya illinoinensis]|uniref:Uncharacterized protein n=1 Tax=Carya illinoinensis TaxID=32201 RepID=A0A922D6V1_CARIL|nr:hypothetical protein I3760_15G012300 [Carya illinoinensis]KAG6673873.1 hypothetical protein I3842_15G013000 [Carya illinoinensis]
MKIAATRRDVVAVAFFFLCFFSLLIKARSIRQDSCGTVDGSDMSRGNHFVGRDQEGCINDHEGELIAMDYTPARTKTPIHNL